MREPTFNQNELPRSKLRRRKPIEIQMEIQRKCMIFFVGIQALPHCQDMPLHKHGVD